MGALDERRVAGADQSGMGSAKLLITNAHRASRLAAWRVAFGPMEKTT